MKVQCGRGHFYNTKWNNRCPHCGSRVIAGTVPGEPVSPEAVEALRDRFSRS